MILKVKSTVLKTVLLLLMVALVAMAILSIKSAIQGGSAYGAVVWASVLLAVAVGLWHLQEWSRAVVVAFIWLLIIVVPLGLINPFAAMDELGSNPASAWQLAVSIYPSVGLGIFVLHILGKHKREFSRRAATQLGVQADVHEKP